MVITLISTANKESKKKTGKIGKVDFKSQRAALNKENTTIPRDKWHRIYINYSQTGKYKCDLYKKEQIKSNFLKKII